MILTILNSNAMASASVIVYDRLTCYIRYDITSHVYNVGLSVA